MDIDQQRAAFSSGFIRGILRSAEINISDELMNKIGDYLAEEFADHVKDETAWCIKFVEAHKWILFKSKLIAKMRQR